MPKSSFCVGPEGRRDILEACLLDLDMVILSMNTMKLLNGKKSLLSHNKNGKCKIVCIQLTGAIAGCIIDHVSQSYGHWKIIHS